MRCETLLLAWKAGVACNALSNRCDIRRSKSLGQHVNVCSGTDETGDAATPASTVPSRSRLRLRRDMQVVATYQSGAGMRLLNERGYSQLVSSAVAQQQIVPCRGSSRAIKSAIQSRLNSAGWATNVRLEFDRGPSINAFHPAGIALQVQVGNMARAFYDLMKLESAWRLDRIALGVLVLPTSKAARAIGDNIANFERITEEHEVLFRTFVQLPLVVYGFE